MNRRTFLRRALALVVLAVVGSLGAILRGKVAGQPAQPGEGGGPPSVPGGAASSPEPGTSVGVGGSALPKARGLIARENERPGDRGWERFGPGRLAGYSVRPSVGPGEELSLQVQAPRPVDVLWYRLGWYGGTGGRLVRIDRGIRPSAPRVGSMPPPDPVSGLVEPNWPPALQFTVPDDWLSGMYLAVLDAAGEVPAAVPFVVRGPSRGASAAPLLFVNAALTWQAYNPWGGKSLYSYDSVGAPTASGTRAAATVSLARPYAGDGGAGFLRRWELQFVRWQEREGLAVEYAADIDLELHPEVLDGRQLIVFAGHHEYWSRPMRQALQAAIDRGTHVCFFSANEIYWQVRLEPGPTGRAERMTCYKSAGRDPLTTTNPALTTVRWREPPVNEPEATLVGQMYGHVVRRPADWIVTNSDHWLYAGTQLADGDRLRNLVGQEYDTYFADLAPPGTIVLARSPVEIAVRRSGPSRGYASPAVHTATIYTAPSGATVFAAGTFQWSWALDSYGVRAYHGIPTPVDWRVERMTRNLLERLAPDAS